jgi:Helix-turn-helix
MADLLKNRLREWRGKRRQKEAAADLDIPVPTYRKYEYGKRTPNRLALAELNRRMDSGAHRAEGS